MVKHSALAITAVLLSPIITSVLSLFCLGRGTDDGAHICERVNISDMLDWLVLCQVGIS